MDLPRELHEMPLVAGVRGEPVLTRREARFTVHLPRNVDAALPAVVFVHGAVAVGRAVAPRDWALYDDYGRLAVQHGLVGVVVDLPRLHFPFQPNSISASRTDLASALARVRALSEIASDRLGIWAFSGGALLVADHIAEPPPWLHGVALSYPMVVNPDDPHERPYAGLVPRCPLLVTRVGQEEPRWLAELDDFLAGARERINVVQHPDGVHGFDVRQDTSASREAVLTAMIWMADHLGG